jgi:hypothetical protein
MNVAILWDIAPRSMNVNGQFEGESFLHRQGLKSAEQETSA